MGQDKRTRRPFGSPAPSGYMPGEKDTLGRRPWEILLCGDLTENQGELLNRLTDVPANSAGLVYFDSCGGSVYTGIALASLMRVRGLKTTAVVISECSSAALLPFAACRKRFVTPHSTLLFHPMRWQSEEDVRLDEATEWARHFKQLETDLDGLLTRLFPIDSEKLHAWTRPGRFVTGSELCEEGLAELINPFDESDVFRTIRTNVGQLREE